MCASYPTPIFKQNLLFPMSLTNDLNSTNLRIRRLIGEKAGGKQKNLAEMANIQPAILTNLLKSNEPIPRRYLIRISKATNARLQWIENGVEPVYYGPEEAAQWDEQDFYEGYMLKDYLDRHNIPYAEFARMMDRSENTVQGYFGSEKLNKKNRVKVFDILGVSEAELFGNDGLAPNKNKTNITSIHTIDETDSSLISVLYLPLSARSGTGYTNYFSLTMGKQFTRVQESMLAEGIAADEHVVIEVGNDNMEPQLMPGFQMLAYKLASGQLPKLNSIVLVDYRGELIIKELSEIDDVSNSIVLRSTNGGATRKVLISELSAVYHIYRYFDAKLML